MTEAGANKSSAEFWLRRGAFFGGVVSALVVGVGNFQAIRIPFAEPIFFAWSAVVLAWAAFHVAARPEAPRPAFASAAFAGLPALAVAAESFIPQSALHSADRVVIRIATAIGVASFLWLLTRIERKRFAAAGSPSSHASGRWARGGLIAILSMLALSSVQVHVVLWSEVLRTGNDLAASMGIVLVAYTFTLFGAIVGLAFRHRVGVWLSVVVACFLYASGLVMFVVVVHDRGWLSFASIAPIVLAVFTTFGSGILWLLPRATPSAQTRS